jgi:hypothetical protein
MGVALVERMDGGSTDFTNSVVCWDIHSHGLKGLGGVHQGAEIHKSIIVSHHETRNESIF